MYGDLDSIMTGVAVVVLIMAGVNIAVMFLILDHVRQDKVDLMDLVTDCLESVNTEADVGKESGRVED